jgi:hypothetical protein
MNQETINKLSASLYRQLFFMKMLEMEYQFFAKLPMPPKFKNIMYRGKNAFGNCANELKANLPTSHETISRVMNENDEKINAMANIIEKLALLDTEHVLMIENDFEAIQVKY